MMPATVELPILVEVDEVDQELLANLTTEAGWMPGSVRSSSARRYTDISTMHILPALQSFKT